MNKSPLEKMQEHPWNVIVRGKDTWGGFLFKRIVQLSEALYLLDENKSVASIPMIFRSIFEALVDLFLILGDENFCKLLEYQELKHLLKIQTDSDLLAYGLKKVTGSKLKKNKNRVRELEEKYLKYVKGFNFKRKLENLSEWSEETWIPLYLAYRSMSLYVHGLPYDPNDLNKMSKTCMRLLPTILEAILERIESRKKQ